MNKKKVLRIGNEAKAIISLQRSQTDPLKCLAEVIENCIDSGATKAEIIRIKRHNSFELTIMDNGSGVEAGSDCECDMDSKAENICNSSKILLTDTQRDADHVIGEFAIGMLGFASIGKFFELMSRCATSKKTRYLNMTAGTVEYSSGDTTYKMERGSRARIWPIHDSIIKRFTAEKICRFIGDKLADRIRQSKIIIKVKDVPRKKEYDVVPKDYKGEKIEISKISTPSGHVRPQLYIAQQGESGCVSVIRQNTEIMGNITEIDELNRPPWNNPLLEGRIVDNHLSTPPTRKGIVVDTHFAEFLTALKSIEGILMEELKEIEGRRKEHITRQMQSELKTTLIGIMPDLPKEYSWFDKKGKHHIGGKENFISDKHTEEGKKQFSTKIALSPNAHLKVVDILPRLYEATFNETVKLTAKAWTKDNEWIRTGITYEWKIKPYTLGSIAIDDNVLVFKAGETEGDVTVRVKATSADGVVAKASASIMITKSKKKKKSNLAHGGFPKPVPVDRPAEKWRSRWGILGEIEYNIGHPDFKKADENGKKGVFRYLLKIYAKHLVLFNFLGEGEDVLLERYIEVLSAIENRI